MSYSEVTDYKDVLLKDFVDEEYIANAEADINDLARTYGVDPAKIPSPCPTIVKRLSIAKVYVSVAVDNSLMNAVTSESGAGKDAYALKLERWETEVKRLEGLLTAQAFLGGEDGLGGGLATKPSFPCSFSMVRS